MKNLTITRKVKCELTADQWQLFTGMSGAAAAAKALNAVVEKACNAEGATYKSAWEAIDKVQVKYADFGAGDSEPNWVVEHILAQVFPDEQ